MKYVWGAVIGIVVINAINMLLLNSPDRASSPFSIMSIISMGILGIVIGVIVTWVYAFFRRRTRA